MKECSSAAVASREPSSSPLCERLSSWTPTVHPERYVGNEYAIAAVMLVAVVRRDKDTGGHAVCDRNEYKSLGGSSRLSLLFGSAKAYKDRRWSSVMVRRYGEDMASAESIPFDEGGCVNSRWNLPCSRRNA